MNEISYEQFIKLKRIDFILACTSKAKPENLKKFKQEIIVTVSSKRYLFSLEKLTSKQLDNILNIIDKLCVNKEKEWYKNTIKYIFIIKAYLLYYCLTK